jgi:CDP-diacylglycerol---glycerol-3-phosphate 3-phosphatidyltransferase
MAGAIACGMGPSAGAGSGGNFADRGGGPKNFCARWQTEGAVSPNQVTVTRVVAAFAAVGLFTFFGNALAADIAAVALTIAAIALDGVDGYLARSRGMATPLGAQLDILGDRVVENLFFTFFAVAGLISLWLPILFFVRGTVIDFLRGLAARAGCSGFGNASTQETWWGRALVTSPGSRAAYAILKCVCFCYLGLLVPVGRWQASWLDADVRNSLLLTGQILAGAAGVFCIVRAVPVVWEGRRHLDLAAVERKVPRRRAAAAIEGIR